MPLVDVKKKEWMEAVALVFDYFRERTPRSFVEAREASIVWNYKDADIEFGRLQVQLPATWAEYACQQLHNTVPSWKF